LRTIIILHLSRNSLYTDGRQTPTDDSLIISSIGQADRSFTVPILEGTNRYKGVVHKITCPWTPKVSTCKKIFTLRIYCSTYFHRNSIVQKNYIRKDSVQT
jgi:hypothetical protein